MSATLSDGPLRVATPPVPGGRHAAAPSHLPAAVPAGRASLSRDVLPTSLLLLGVGLLVLLAQAGPLSYLQHSRSQSVAYAELRRDLSAGTVPTGQLTADGTPTAPGTPLGYLSSRALGLEREVFFEGTTATVLEKGPGHRRSSVLPGQAGVAVLYGRADAYGGPFHRVRDLEPGATVSFTTGLGTSTYEVVRTRRAGDPFAGPRPGQGLLTLVSATGPRFVPRDAVYVDAELVTPVLPSAARHLGNSDLAAAEGPMKGDPSAWALLFLATLGLAVAAPTLAWARARFGSMQAWLVGVPVAGLLLVVTSQQVLRLLPNLL